MPVLEERDLATDELIRGRQNTLVSIVSRAKPFTGVGYFNIDGRMIVSIIGAATTYIIVLVQFRMSETSSTCAINVTFNKTKLLLLRRRNQQLYAFFAT